MNTNTSEGTRAIYFSGKKGTGQYTVVDASDYDLVSRYKWTLSTVGYAQTTHYERPGLRKPTVLLHRLLMGFPEGFEVDHADMDKLNNCRSNLRLATKQQNAANRGLVSTNSSGFRGVSLVGKSRIWRARVNVNDKEIHLGCFKTPEAAAHAVDRAHLLYFGEFARPNFPQ